MHGLPWTNPQKVTIKADEYVSDMTINRGLLNLLNNDYYLDLKAEALNKYIEENIDTHMADKSIHFTWESVTQQISEEVSNSLTANMVCRIPIYKENVVKAAGSYNDNGEQTTTTKYQIFNNKKMVNKYNIPMLKTLISSIPRNLNNKILIIEFCIPLSNVWKRGNTKYLTDKNFHAYKDDTTYKTPVTLSGVDTVLDLKSLNICFENFFGGTLIVCGNLDYFIDDLPATRDSKTVTINDENYKTPVTHVEPFEAIDVFENNSLSNFYISLSCKEIQKKLVNLKTVTDKTKQIQIKSTGINNYYSTLSFKNNYCETYLYNLHICNSLSANDKVTVSTYDFPSQDDVLCYWPLNDNTSPGFINTDYLTLDSAENNWVLFNNNCLVVSDSDASFDCYKMNMPNLIGVNNLFPGYFSFDSDATIDIGVEKQNSNIIKNIIYNLDGNFPQSTIVMWGKLEERDNGKNPFLTDYNYKTNNGIILSPEQVSIHYRNDLVLSNKIKEAGTYDGSYAFPTDFARHEDKLLGNWVMYVYRLTHTSEDGKNFLEIEINAWVKGTGELVQLLPVPGTNQNNKFEIPEHFIETLTNMRLFGYQYRDEQYDYPRLNWNLWNGSVRNVMIFRDDLSPNQEKSLFNGGVNQSTKNGDVPISYNWMEMGEYERIKQLNNSSYLGGLFVYNTNNFYVKQNKFSQNIPDLTKITFIKPDDTKTS
jgi:hypothetical protein